MANVVAIVGRSNVGKSTLFNRLIGKRKAIVHSSMDTTRDRHYGDAYWNGKHFVIADTGGYIDDGRENIFADGICSQINIALDESKIILLVVDGQVGVTALDKHFANILRTLCKPVLLVVNKAEGFIADVVLSRFYGLGFDRLFAISAINGQGTGDLLDAVVGYFGEDDNVSHDEEVIPKFTILGRPNVGKSSFFNALIQQQRSIVSSLSGTTRDAIVTKHFYCRQPFILTDTAGVRRRTKVKEPVEFYSVQRSIKAIEDADVCLVIIDGQYALEDQDMTLISLTRRHKKGVVLLVNKWDLVSGDQQAAYQYRQHLAHQLSAFDYIPVLYVSAFKKPCIRKVLEKALEVYQNKIRKISTSELNKAMLPIVESTHPPAYRGRHINIKYCLQVGGSVPTFVFFCNHPYGIRENYKVYLEKQLRRIFCLHGVPIQILFKKK